MPRRHWLGRTSFLPGLAGDVAAMVALALASTPVQSAPAPAGQSDDGVWRVVDEAPLLAARPERWIVPRAYRVFLTDPDVLRRLLSLASSLPEVLTLPMPDGTFARFLVRESPILEEPLAARFPGIRTYTGQGIDDPAASMRCDWTPMGFHAMVLSASGTVYVDPYGRGDVSHYISYLKRDFDRAGKQPVCLVDGDATVVETSTSPGGAEAAASALTSVGPTLRTYRLAVAATGEYTAYFGGTVEAALAAITTTVNRVTGVYERELAIRLVLIAGEPAIIYTDAATDPYTNGNASAMIGENQSNLDLVIGSASYDIGHVFGTGGSGMGALASVCTANKGRGASTLLPPLGDPFDVGFVAHEMGHQFGANHTFNGTTGSCAAARVATSAYEPGSGSTIMSYAGDCGAESLQPLSDDYFHTRSFDEIVSHVSGAGACSSNAATGNAAPTIDAGPSFTIPMSTPFVLTAAAASDPDGDSLTYAWEQFDLGTAAPPNTDNGTRPIFRSFLPTTSASRTLPKLSDILTGASTIGESLPTTNRTMNFRVTARDNRANGGGVNYDLLQVVSTNSAGPFAVTQPNTAVTWPGSSTQTVTWNVAGTAAAPVSTAHVNILLSTDGGLTFPIVLTGGTANDGSETVLIPNTPTSTARVKVEAVGNIFFDISNVDFTITPEPTTPLLTLGTIGKTPAGVDGDAYIEPGESWSLSIMLTNNGTAATHVTGALTSSTPGVTVVTTQPVAYPDLPRSASGWNASPFYFAVSSSVPCGQTLSFALTVSCAEAAGPEVHPFTLSTGESFGSTYSYTTPPVPIPDNNTTGASVPLTVAGFGGSLSDLNFRFDGASCSSTPGSTTVGLDHTWVGDLVVTLTSPAATPVTLISRAGGINNAGRNFCQTVLDDEAGTSIQTVTAAGAPYVGSFRPNAPLAAFDGQNPNGVWTLKVSDHASLYTGTIRSFSLIASGVRCDSPLANPGAVPDGTGPGAPLTLTKSDAELTLAWGASCSASGVDYAIYQGTVGAYYSHGIKLCTTQGLPTATFPPDAGNLYYLVVPLTADSEGSYGTDSTPVARPAASPACKPQQFDACP